MRMLDSDWRRRPTATELLTAAPEVASPFSGELRRAYAFLADFVGSRCVAARAHIAPFGLALHHEGLTSAPVFFFSAAWVECVPPWASTHDDRIALAQQALPELCNFSDEVRTGVCGGRASGYRTNDGRRAL